MNSGVLAYLIYKLLPVIKKHPIAALLLGAVCLVAYLGFKEPSLFTYKSQKGRLFIGISLIVLLTLGGILTDSIAKKNTVEESISVYPADSPYTNGDVSFTGEMRDPAGYDYYMREARKHKNSAEYYDGEARKALDSASSYSDKPDVAKSYIDLAKDKQYNYNNEIRMYNESIEKANSCK